MQGHLPLRQLWVLGPGQFAALARSAAEGEGSGAQGSLCLQGRPWACGSVTAGARSQEEACFHAV